ncbi:MAG: GerMN domain-containing protein [Candidatus Jacksonbacteria bacterium]
MKTLKPIITIFSLSLLALVLTGCEPAAIEEKPTANDSNIFPKEVKIDETTTPVNQDDSQAFIKVTSPQPNDIISSPVIIVGQARGNWFFEGNFPIKILDDSAQELATGLANAQGEWMTTDFVPFKAEIEFKPTTETGAIVLIKNNPSDKRELDDQLQIPIKFAISIKIYFIDKKEAETRDCSATKEFIKTIPYTQAVGTAAINEMLKGPTVEEAEITSNNIPKNTKLLSLKIENSTAYVDFSQELQNYGGGSCNVSAIRAQIESTLKQFPTVDKVIISVEGQTENILQP